MGFFDIDMNDINIISDYFIDIYFKLYNLFI